MRSTKLDYSFKQDQLEILTIVGNKIANEYYEYKIPTYYKNINLRSSMNECAKFVDDKYIRKLFAPQGIKHPVQRYLETIAKGNVINDHISTILDTKDLKKPYVSLIKINIISAVPNKSENLDLLSGNDNDGFTEFKTSEIMKEDTKNIDLMDNLTHFNFNPETNIDLSEVSISKPSKIAKAIDVDILSLYSGNVAEPAIKKIDHSRCYNFFPEHKQQQLPSDMRYFMKDYPIESARNYGYNTNYGANYNNQYMNMPNQYQQIPYGISTGIYSNNVKNSNYAAGYNPNNLNSYNNLNKMFGNYQSTPQVTQHNVSQNFIKESKNFDITSLYNQDKQFKSAYSGIHVPSS